MKKAELITLIASLLVVVLGFVGFKVFVGKEKPGDSTQSSRESSASNEEDPTRKKLRESHAKTQQQLAALTKRRAEAEESKQEGAEEPNGVPGLYRGQKEAIQEFLKTQPTIRQLLRKKSFTAELFLASDIESSDYHNYYFRDKEDTYASYDCSNHKGESCYLYVEHDSEAHTKLLDLEDKDDLKNTTLLVSIPSFAEGETLQNMFILDAVVYDEYRIETAAEETLRGGLQKKIREKALVVFGDERDALIEKHGGESVRRALQMVKTGGEPKYRSTLDLVDALYIALSKQGRIPLAESERKNWLKSVLGKPDSSEIGDFDNNRQFLTWRYRDVLRNEDTERYSEDVGFAFGSKLMINISGPSGRGGTGGGINHPTGVQYQTYIPLEGLFLQQGYKAR